MRKILLYTLTAFAFLSCEKEIELSAEEIAPRIVINSIFSANDTCWIHISESGTIVGQSNLPNIENATANFLDENGSVLASFTHDADGNYFITNPLPQAGNVYGIEVSAAGYTSISASSETPSIISISNIDTTSASSIWEQQLSFDLTFADDASQSNYYGISVVVHGFWDDGFGNWEEWSWGEAATQEVFTDNGAPDVDDGLIYANEFYFSDETFNGQSITFNALQYFEIEDSMYYVVKLKSMSEDLYKYRVSYSKYVEAQNDFFAEPVQVYSNIENGFGVFGGYSEYSDTIWVE